RPVLARDGQPRARLAGAVHARRGGAGRGAQLRREEEVNELVLVEREPEGRIATVLLNRPDRLNALNEQIMGALVAALGELDSDNDVRCIVLGGSDRTFAAGADIAEMADASVMDMVAARRVDRWDAIRAVRTPIVAAVSGFCLGGGCELAMSC